MLYVNANKILIEILSVQKNNSFLLYIVERLQKKNYRGWHISQHNRYDLSDIENILCVILKVSGTDFFAIPPGDFKKGTSLPSHFIIFQEFVNGVSDIMKRGTINSLKKNFFPDLIRMKFLERKKLKTDEYPSGVFHGKLTSNAVDFIEADLVTKYKLYTDAIDRMFEGKISELAEMINLSDYNDDGITIYELMFILSDSSKCLNKMSMLSSWRSLSKHKRIKVIDLIKSYSRPSNFDGDKNTKRDFGNWKNEAQQIIRLLKATVYFEVDAELSFRLNVSSKGFFQKTKLRSSVPKQKYFDYHNVNKQSEFELHHIIPISSARNKKEAIKIDDYRNLIYIDRARHREVSRNGNNKFILTIDAIKAVFSDLDRMNHVKAENGNDALYTKELNKIEKISDYNIKLLMSIFEFEKDNYN